MSGPRRAAELESIQARLVPDYNDVNPGYPESWVSPWRNRSDEEPDEERMDRRWKSFPKRSDKQGDKNMQGSFRRYVSHIFCIVAVNVCTLPLHKRHMMFEIIPHDLR